MITFSQSVGALANRDAAVYSSKGRLIASHETNSRLDRIAEGLKIATNRHCLTDEFGADVDRLASQLHASQMLDFIRETSENCRDGRPVYTKRFQTPSSTEPSPIEASTWSLARSAASVCLSAANAISDQDTRVAYALCRPPGHHVGREFFGAYCYLNNAALAAFHLRRDHGLRVAVLDIDYHAGNGTLDCLGGASEIPFASLHRSTEEAFPYCLEPSPYHDAQLMIGLRGQVDENTYLDALRRAIEALNRTELDTLIVSIGYDIIDGDPHGGWHLQPCIYRLIGKLLSDASLPILFIQEGGYLERSLSQCASALEEGLSKRKDPT